MITVFWARYSYLNPGMPLLMEELARAGPQSVAVVDVTQTPPTRVRDLAAESSSIVIDQSVYNAATWAVADVASVYLIHDLRPRAHYDEIMEVLLGAEAPKLFALYFDLHDAKNAQLVERLRGRVQAVSWMFEKEPVHAEQVPEAYRDEWMADGPDMLAMWRSIVAAFPVRVELPFALGPHEFASAPPRHRWDVLVAGAPYRTRVIAQRSRREDRLSVAPYRAASMTISGMTRVASRVLPAERASRVTIGVLQRLQRWLLQSTPVSFVCGSGLGFAVRKFFETPAARNAMVALPCVGFEDFGFRDGVHALVAAPEDAGRAARALVQDRATRDRVVAEAYALMEREHSVRRRAAQLVTCMQRLERGALSGAQFIGGVYQIV